MQLSLEAVLLPRRHTQSTPIHSCCSSRIRVDFHTSDEDNQVIDSFPGVVPVRGPCSTGYLNANTPRLFFNSSSTQLFFRTTPTMMSGILGLPTIEAV